MSEWTFAVDIREFFPAPFQQLSQCHTTSSLVIDLLYCICVSLIYTLICVSTIGFVNISFKIIKESQLVYFKFLNMIYSCFSQSFSVADLEPVRSGVFFVESGSDHIYRLLNLKNKGQQFPTNKLSYSYSMYFKKEVVSVYVVSTI